MRRGFLPIAIGPALLIVGAIILLMIAIPILAISFSRELMLLFQFGASIIIYNWVRNTIGPGTLSLVIAGVLIYIFVFILPQFTMGLYTLYFLLTLGIMSTIIFMGMLFPPVPLFKK